MLKLPRRLRRSNAASLSADGEGFPTFRYIGKDDHYEGVMAQDVLKVMPLAVSVGDDGYYRVNYDMLGIEMHRLD